MIEHFSRFEFLILNTTRGDIAMGLDMYLTAKRTLEEGLPVAEMDPVAKVDAVILEIGFWRKSHHIHRWFVNNVQKNIDNCAIYHVSREKLMSLKKVCQVVIKCRHLAEEMLPSVDNKFDETYFKNILHTINVIKTCLSLPYYWEFYYEANW